MIFRVEAKAWPLCDVRVNNFGRIKDFKISHVVLDFVPLIATGFSTRFFLPGSLGSQIGFPLRQMLKDCRILLNSYPAPWEDKPLVFLQKSVAANIFSAEQWFNQFGATLVSRNQFFPCSAVNHEGVVKTSGDSAKKFSLDIFAEWPTCLHDLFEHGRLRI